jgi:hypothetical protein
MDRKPKDLEHTPQPEGVGGADSVQPFHGSEAWWKFVARPGRAAELKQSRQARREIDENLLACYLSGACTPEEREKVEEAMKKFPEIRETVQIVRETLGSNVADSPRPLVTSPTKDGSVSLGPSLHPHAPDHDVGKPR